MWEASDILRQIITGSGTICCLCLSAADGDSLRVYDEILLEGDPQCTLQMTEIIASVFQNKFLDNGYVSQCVCKECAKSTISAYKFVRKCSDRNNYFGDILKNLSSCLEYFIDTRKIKGIYVATDLETCFCKLYYDSKPSVSHMGNVIRRFQSLLCSKNKVSAIDNILPSFYPKTKCEFCGVLFSNKYTMKIHIQSCKSNIQREVDAMKICCVKSTYDKINKQNDISNRGVHNSCINLNLFNKKEDSSNDNIDCLHSSDEAILEGKTPAKNKIKMKQKVYFQKLERESCRYCSASLTNKYALKKHLLLNCKNVMQKLGIEDNIELKALLDFNKKIQEFQQSQMATCDYCGTSYNDKYHLRNHITYRCLKNENKLPKPKYNKPTVPTGYSKVICSLCGKAVQRSFLKIHEQNHLEINRRFQCSKCGKLFRTEKGYHHHTLIPNCKLGEYVPLPKTYSCHICGKLFSKHSILNIHLKAWHSDSGFQCQLCNKKLSSKGALKEHMVVHTQEKNFVCTICGGKFVSKASLLYHTHIHTGETPYKCSYCERSFLSSSRRNMHIRIHHLPPQLKCSLCTKKFKHWTALNRHQRRHLDPKSSLYLGKTVDVIARKTENDENDYV